MTGELEYSAGVIAYRKNAEGDVEVMLSHSGLPYDNGQERSWTIQKGHVEKWEDNVMAASREFHEETGFYTKGRLWRLGTFKVTRKKILTVFYMGNDYDTRNASSNYTDIEWPIASGQIQSFPETDGAEWFNLADAKSKVFFGQVKVLERFEEELPRINERENRKNRSAKTTRKRKTRNKLFYTA